MYDSLLRECKEKQSEILGQIQDHADADEDFHLTANITLNIAKRAKSIFKSSEDDEKNQFLRYLLQNCTMNGKKLTFTMVSPFNVIAQYHDSITLRRRRDSNSRYGFPYAAFRVRYLQPLSHVSVLCLLFQNLCITPLAVYF